MKTNKQAEVAPAQAGGLNKGCGKPADHPFPERARPRLQAAVAKLKTAAVLRPQDFNEADCGGVFDGFQVTSDADPGL